MTLKVGDTLPTGSFNYLQDGMQTISSEALFANKTVVLFSVPGAYTPTCSARHLPGFVDHFDDFKARGVDTIACLAVNDAFVMDAWGKSQHADGKIMMLADGNGDYARALGLELDATKFGMGKRAQRFALIAKNGEVSHLAIEAPGEFKVSAADAVLAAL
jgi:glutaredoxin/glutathione-dependent peroxiredoxin